MGAPLWRTPVHVEGNRSDDVEPCTLLLRAERRAAVWRLSGFDSVHLRDEIAAVIPGQIVTIDPKAVRAFRPSYRLLSYYLASRGIPVPDDLPGIDRPDLADALVREVYGWAGLSVPR